MSLAPPQNDYVAARLAELVNATVEKANSLMDVDTTPPPPTPPILNTPQLVAEFMMIVRALRPASRVDHLFAQFHACLRNLPHHMRLKEDELRAFGADYSETTRLARVKADEQQFLLFMAQYEHARQVEKDLENMLTNTRPQDILDRLLNARSSVHNARKQLDAFTAYKIETLQQRASFIFCISYFFFFTDSCYCSPTCPQTRGLLGPIPISYIIQINTFIFRLSFIRIAARDCVTYNTVT